MADPPTHWLYPTNDAPNSGYHLEDLDSGDWLPVSPESVWYGLRRHPDRIDDWGLSNGFNIMRAGDAVWLYAAGRQYVYALAQAAQIWSEDGLWSVKLNWDLPGTQALEASPIPRANFGQVPQNVCRANPRTQAVLETWLTARGIGFSRHDDPDGPMSDRDARTRVLREIALRRGQVAFRRQLLAAYDHRCAITGETAEQVLEAAHIKRHRGEHTNVVRNGLLLRSDVHTLFDLNLLGIDPLGRVVISEVMKGTSYWALHGKLARLPVASRSRPSKRLQAERLRGLVTAVGTAHA